MNEVNFAGPADVNGMGILVLTNDIEYWRIVMSYAHFRELI